jgi:limonene-1,2-epoxide hydrolase
LPVRIGYQAGFSSQQANTVAIGTQAGYTGQGANSIAIGALAGYTGSGTGTFVHANTILLNASGASLITDRADATFIHPIRNTGTNNTVYYNTTSKEISYSSFSGIVQIQSATKTDTFTTTSGTPADITGLSVSITPRSVSNKIFVVATVSGMSEAGVNDAFLQLVRDSTALCIGDAAGSRTRCTTTFNKIAGGSLFNAPMSYLDSPNTTSSTTYKVQIWKNAASGGTVFVNRTDTDSNSAAYPRTASTITVFEVMA